MPKNRPLYRGNPAITILRIFLWLMPAFLIPLLAVLGGFLSNYLPTPANISLMLLLWFAATAGIGLFEDLLRFQQMRFSHSGAGRELASSTIYFVLLQIVFAPGVFFATIAIFAAAAAYGLF
jgi:hypothetical protein